MEEIMKNGVVSDRLRGAIEGMREAMVDHMVRGGDDDEDVKALSGEEGAGISGCPGSSASTRIPNRIIEE